MNKHISHGEVNLFSGASIPNGANKLKAAKGRYIVGDSETVGNYHCVKEADGIELYEANGIIYLKNDVEAEIFCPDKSRHDTVKLEPGIWEIERANEFDHLKNETRKVQD